ncbi:cytochrome P450 [Pisolithus tinctorius]|nr:cytochrome P450 [Pisolithus tinctorius]
MFSSSSPEVYLLVSAGLVGITVQLFLQCQRLNAIPTVGSTNWGGSWRSAIKNIRGTSGVVQEGYNRYKNVPFKIPLLYNWMVVVSGAKLLEEVKAAPDDQLSAAEGTNDFLKIAFTMGHRVANEPYHFVVIKTQLNRKLSSLCPIVEDEISVALSEVFSSQGNEWKPVVALEAIQKVVSGASNRIFVGLPLCRNPDWLEFGLQFAVDSLVSAAKMDLFPRFMWPIIASLVTSTESQVGRAVEFLGPIIRERQKIADRARSGEVVNMPDDFLQWLIDTGIETTEREITQRILVMVFASVHVTASSLMCAVYNLAAHPEYLEPLREEVDTVVRQHGWTKAATDKMYKIDSFLKESLRLGGASSLIMLRKVLKDFTFSDGRVIPRGCYISAPSCAIHHDEEFYDKPNAFDPFRFVRPRSNGKDMKQGMVSLAPDYLAFGHGKHACPGRFAAAMIQKTILAHIVSSYDLKLDDDAPASCRTVEFGIFIAPDPTTTVLLRKRAT